MEVKRQLVGIRAGLALMLVTRACPRLLGKAWLKAAAKVALLVLVLIPAWACT